MKVYKFFRIPDEDDYDDFDIERRYTLYAITNNKKYAKRFKEDRNMKNFICKIHDDIDKDEYSEMCNAERGTVLDLYPLKTVFDNVRISRNAETNDVLMTYNEKQILDDAQTIIDDESFWRTMPYPLLFKTKYVNILKQLQYLSYFTLMTYGILPDNLMEKLSKVNDDYSTPTIVPDEVAIFIDTFRETF